MESRRITVGDRTWSARIGGPQSRHTVLLLPDTDSPTDVNDRVCERLHTADLRTVVIDTAPGLDPETVYRILDEVEVPWTYVAGCGAGALPAWQLAARGFGRVIGLVVAGRGHPAAPGPDGTATDPGCPAVELPTTLIADKHLSLEAAEASRRFVYGEFRIARVDVADVVAEAGPELATEIVLRSGQW